MSFRWSKTLFPHLFAEIAAAPICHEFAFLENVRQISPSDNATKSLWKSTEEHLAIHFSSVRLEELNSLRDWIWFSNSRQCQSRKFETRQTITSYMVRLSESSLERRGDYLVPRIPDDDERTLGGTMNYHQKGRDFWVWLTKALPGRLVAFAGHQGKPVNFLSPIMQNTLEEKGFAEVHMHLGASLTFPFCWVSLLRKLLVDKYKPDFLAWPGSAFEDGRKMAMWTLAAAIVRQVLAAFLNWKKLNDGSLQEFLQNYLTDNLTRSSVLRAIQSVQGPKRSTLTHDLRTILMLQRSFKRLAGQNLISRPCDSASDFLKLDPISRHIREPITNERHCEDIWVKDSVSFIQQSTPNQLLSPSNCPWRPSDEATLNSYESLFWQVQRIKTLTYRHLTQAKGNTGLESFLRYYPRIKAFHFAGLDKKVAVQIAAQTSGLTTGLKSLEVRIAPDDNKQTMANEVENIVDGVSLLRQSNFRKFADKTPSSFKSTHTQSPNLEAGIVFHFVKERSDHNRDAINRNMARSGKLKKPRSMQYRYEFARYAQKISAQTNSIAWLLRRYPLALQWVRGIDICNDELSIPTWVFVGAFQKIREASQIASQIIHNRFRKRIPQIRTTVHAGEDFSHLLTGIRRVDEAIEYLKISEGDRIGHGLAIGVNPDSWATNIGPVSIPKIVRMFDLAWEHSMYSANGGVPSDRVPELEWQLRSLIDELFGHWKSKEWSGHWLSGLNLEIPTIDRIVKLRKLAATPRELAKIGFPNCVPLDWIRRYPVTCSNPDSSLLLGYLCDQKFLEIGSEPIILDPKSECGAIESMQRIVRKKISDRQIAIEINPSSNELVGAFGAIKDHPVWRLDSPDAANESPVLLCIGSDDPVVFATDLPQEYQRLHDALVESGFTNKQSLDWLDEIRESGLKHRFTIEPTLPSDIRSFPINFTN